MKNGLKIFVYLIFICVYSGIWAAPGSVSLGEVMKNNLDKNLLEKLDISKKIALRWQVDARLHEVRLNFSESGKIKWRFHWISNSSKSYLVLFSNKLSFRQKGADPSAEQKANLKIDSTVGFNKLGSILQSKGVDLKKLKVGDIVDFKLSYEKWKTPKGYYYYVFLSSGAQYYIHAQTGQFKK